MVEKEIFGTGYAGSCDFENYWGEELSTVILIHYLSDILHAYENSQAYSVIYDLADKSKKVDALNFIYYLDDAMSLDFWRVKITTVSGRTYESNDLRCSIRAIDLSKAIIGVNGESKRMYISMKSGSCSTSMNLIG